MPRMTARDRLSWMADMPCLLETLRMAEALEDGLAMNLVRVKLLSLIKRMYDLDDEAAIRRFNIMTEAIGVESILEREVPDVLSGL